MNLNFCYVFFTLLSSCCFTSALKCYSCKDPITDGEFVKKKQCKKATWVWKINSFSDQRWKLDGSVLKNKAGVWKSVNLWNFKTKDKNLIYIENTSTKKVLGVGFYSDSSCYKCYKLQEDFVEDSEFVKKPM